MARNRTISPDFWTWEAVIDCAPMTRLLFLGLWNFADDFGVQPLRPRTIRLQVFPGDAVDNAAVRAMIDELAGQVLVRLYSVEGQDYVEIVDWDQFQQVNKRARRRFPSPCKDGEKVPSVSEAGEGPLETIANHSIGEASQSPSSEGEPQRWREMIKDVLRQRWPHDARIEMIDDEAADRWGAKWMDEGCDIGDDIMPAVRDYYVEDRFRGPPADLGQLDDSVTGYRLRREARERARAAA